MKPADLAGIVERLRKTIAGMTEAPTIGIIGQTPVTLELIEILGGMEMLNRLTGIYLTGATGLLEEPSRYRPLSDLKRDKPSIVIIASDEHKEVLLESAVPYLAPTTKVLIGGFSHFAFTDELFDNVRANALLPSFANGYPNSLIHIYQCLKNAARLGLSGIVVEFGMFKGGTTMLMSHFIEKLGQKWKVYGLDTFGGFPPSRSPLDMYAHPDCVFRDQDAVERMFKGRNVEIIAGDIAQTANQIANEDIVLAFVDTDNYTPANAAIKAIQDRVVVGGAIVFDHFTGRDRHLDTIGERIAAKQLLEDPRYFQLHDTGVFLRQQ